MKQIPSGWVRLLNQVSKWLSSRTLFPNSLETGFALCSQVLAQIPMLFWKYALPPFLVTTSCQSLIKYYVSSRQNRLHYKKKASKFTSLLFCDYSQQQITVSDPFPLTRFLCKQIQSNEIQPQYENAIKQAIQVCSIKQQEE